MRKLQGKKRKRLRINPKNPALKEFFNVKFELATMTGQCCWKMGNTYFSGISFTATIPKTFQPG